MPDPIAEARNLHEDALAALVNRARLKHGTGDTDEAWVSAMAAADAYALAVLDETVSRLWESDSGGRCYQHRSFLTDEEGRYKGDCPNCAPGLLRAHIEALKGGER